MGAFARAHGKYPKLFGLGRWTYCTVSHEAASRTHAA
jgi:hypothetical protein